MTPKFKYADFWLRFVAGIIDLILVLIVSSILGYILPLLSTIITILVAGGYSIYLESSEYQATLGKFFLGLKVTDLKGKRLTTSMAAIRFAGKGLSVFTLGIGFILAGFTDKKQALHDLIAETLVLENTINENSKNTDEEAIDISSTAKDAIVS